MPGNFMALTAYRAELTDMRGKVWADLLVSLVGRAVGGLLLVWTGEARFEKAVPWLMLTATLFFALGEWIKARLDALRNPSRKPSRAGLLAPGRETHLSADFVDWLQANNTQLFLPCIAVAELAQDICKLHRTGGAQRAARLARWLDELIEGFGERILALDAAAARLAGQLSDQALAQGKHPGFADLAIAALAQHNGQLC